MTQIALAKNPQPVVLEGAYCRLEPLEERHAADLFAAIAPERFEYLPSQEVTTEDGMLALIDKVVTQTDAIYFAVINKTTGKCGGFQAFLRLRPEHGSIEVGSVLWGDDIARTHRATEAIYLMAKHVFDDLGNYRFEWKCNNLNAASKRAAVRFGFTYEGVFRKDMIVKNTHRNTAWFSMLDEEWQILKPIYQAWLEPDNFDAEGQAKTRLATPRHQPAS